MKSLAERPLWSTIALHILPGALATAAYLIMTPPLMARGFPALFSLLLATLLVLIPFELGYLLFQARGTDRTPFLRDVVVFREPVAAWLYLAGPLALFVWGILSSALTSRLEAALRGAFFGWLPHWYAASSALEFTSYSRPVLLATFVVGLVTVGFLGPIIEELYFRGHLLPRLARTGHRAPLLNAMLFSAYHLWTPWQNPSRILLMVPLAFMVWRTRNIYLGMAAHCTLNAIVWCVTFGAILKTTS